MGPLTIVVANPTHDYTDLEQIADVRTGNPPEKPPNTEGELIELVKDADVLLITSRERISRQVIESAPELQLILKYGAAPDRARVDYEAATKNGVVIEFTEGSNAASVAEHTVMFILATLKNLEFLCSRVKTGGWKKRGLGGIELKGKTVGLIGFGLISRAVRERLSSFEVELAIYDPYVDNENLAEYGVAVDDIGKLCKITDIISVHCPLTEETRGLIGEDQLKMMKPTAVVVNTARGEIIDEEALATALTNDWIHGAGLDVFTEEPPDSKNPLLSLSNVIATPHTAGVTREVLEREKNMAHEEAISVLQGDEPQWVANPDVL